MTFSDASKIVDKHFKSARYWGEYKEGIHYWGFRGGYVSFCPETCEIHAKNRNGKTRKLK